MIIYIKRHQDEKKLEEFKYELLLKKIPEGIKVGYNWNLKGESTDETMEDFHLFCISIVKDLFEKNFKTNEGYELDEEDFDLENLRVLYDTILIKKLKNS